jgi:hypothetical protein
LIGHSPQRRAGPQKMILPDDVIKRLRPQLIRQRTGRDFVEAGA